MSENLSFKERVKERFSARKAALLAPRLHHSQPRATDSKSVRKKPTAKSQKAKTRADSKPQSLLERAVDRISAWFETILYTLSLLCSWILSFALWGVLFWLLYREFAPLLMPHLAPIFNHFTFFHHFTFFNHFAALKGLTSKIF